MSIGTGDIGPVEAAPRVVRDDRGVTTTFREWYGRLADLNVIAGTLATPYEIQYVRGDTYRLTTGQAGNIAGGAPTPAPESLVTTTWDLKVTQQRRDLWEHWRIRNELEKITWRDSRAQFLADLRACAVGELILIHRLDAAGNLVYEKDQTGTLTSKIADIRITSKMAIDYVVAQFGCDRAILEAFSEELSRGVDSFLYDTFTLSRKKVGPAAATNLLTEFAQVNQIFRTGTLLATETTIPNAIRAPIVNQLSAGYWIRQADELQQVNGNQVEIASQWTYLQTFSQFIYGTAV